MPGDPVEEVITYFEFEAALIAQAGISWNRTLNPGAGQFKREIIEATPGAYDWSFPDGFVKTVQSCGLSLLVQVEPWTSWDQPGVPDIDYGRPNNMDAWRNFVRNLVERYDGDSVEDVSGLAYGIKHWGIGNEPELGRFDGGSAQDYFDTLKV